MNKALERKIEKVIATKATDPQVESSLRHLSEWYVTNTPDTRRVLRTEIERRALIVNKEFLSVFREVQEKLMAVDKDVNQLKSYCTEMEERLATTHKTSGRLIAQAEDLRSQRDQNDMREELSTKFLKTFQLTGEELTALRDIDGDKDLTQTFFDALSRASRIHEDCKVLLRTHQRAGIQIIETMGTHQQAADDKLFHWLKGKMEMLAGMDEVEEVPPMVLLAVDTLHQRQPTLLKYCIEKLEHTRAELVVTGFRIAITVGGPSGIPRPIEIHAHDPLRYISDILAWIHQSLATELELVGRILNVDVKRRNYDALSEKELSLLKDKQTRVEEAVDAIFSALTIPFKVRFEQVLEAEPEAVVMYQLANILHFYATTVSHVLLPSAKLTECLKDCNGVLLSLFYSQLKGRADAMTRNPPAPPLELHPPRVVHESIHHLMEIMATFDESLVPVHEREAEFSPVLSAVIDPLIQTCNESATSLRAPSIQVYLINCLQCMKSALSTYPFASARCEGINMHIETHVDMLINEEASAILHRCGLAEKLKIMKYRTRSGPLSKEPSMDAKAMALTLRMFEQSLFEIDKLMMPHCDKLLDPVLRQKAKERVVSLISDAYTEIHDAVIHPENEYGKHDALSIVHYKPTQVKTLLLGGC